MKIIQVALRAVFLGYDSGGINFMMAQELYKSSGNNVTIGNNSDSASDASFAYLNNYINSLQTYIDASFVAIIDLEETNKFYSISNIRFI